MATPPEAAGAHPCDEVPSAAVAQRDIERAMLADAEELAGAGTFEHDIASGTMLWSAGMYRIYGIPEQSEPTSARADGLDPRDRDRVRSAERDALAGNATLLESSYRILRPDGEVRWLLTRSRIARSADGVAVRCSGVSLDTTQRRRREEALAAAVRDASERATRQIIEPAHDAFISLDASGAITAWNPKAETMFGWSRGDVLGRDLADLLIPESRRAAHRRGIERFLTTGEERVLNRRLELMLLHSSGYEFLVELTISAIESETGYTFNAFLRDITERRRAERELALARDEALAASRTKSMFVANVSHEIRTPMNGVIGMTELLLDTHLDARQREYVETISSSGESLLAVIDDILDLSKIEAGKLELDPTDFDLRDAIERACGMLAARAHGKGLELVVAIDPEVPAWVHGDAARLGQVIANLVSNAIKFTSAGEVVVSVSARVPGDGVARVRVEVSDTGIGIEPEALRRLYAPFSQADSSTTRRYGGTGLGLAISKHLIELLGGAVGASSVPGVGSRFWLELPLAGGAVRPGPREERRTMAGLRGLVVDDNAASRATLERQLSSRQMRCDVAEDAARALQLLRTAADAHLPYALVLLDLGMPDVDGYELARSIRDEPALSGVKLVALSTSVGRSDSGDEAALFDAVLNKPVRESRLDEEIGLLVTDEHPALRPVPRPTPVGAAERWHGASVDVLVVEDTLVNQMVAVRMLERCGVRARVAENGRSALEELARHSYAAVLMDCQMPELDGYETTQELRRLEQGGPRTPIIAMTANSMRGERERCLAAGMDDYLIKPLRSRTLMEALTRWIVDPATVSSDREAAGPAAGAPPADPHRPGLIDEAVLAGVDDLGDGMLSELLVLYADEIASTVSELGEALDRGHALAVGQAAHKLRGTGAAVGAARVAHIAGEIESSAHAGDLATATDLLETLRASVRDTGDALRRRSVAAR
jgi:two-component system sensor histidine kinase/response regulator